MLTKIVVVGAGYVGLASALLIARRYDVTILDIDQQKINGINNKRCPIADPDMQLSLETEGLRLRAALSNPKEYEGADLVIIAAPTNFDDSINCFDTSAVEQVVQDVLSVSLGTIITVKSTVPVGFMDGLQKKFPDSRLLFSPEFLREGSALRDNRFPSRIVVGGDREDAELFGDLMLEGCENEGVPVVYTSTAEAEAIKLFANSYLAMRVAFFNELDTFAQVKGLSTLSLVQGLGHDKRIGAHYNNPSFGYGGYCLPKDTKQLLSDFEEVPQQLIQAIIESNRIRKQFVAKKIIERRPDVVGVFRLVMKAGSDNFRASAVQDVIKELSAEGVEILIYEPVLDADYFGEFQVFKVLEEWKKRCDVIVANRMDADLIDVKDKVYTCDLFGTDS